MKMVAARSITLSQSVPHASMTNERNEHALASLEDSSSKADRKRNFVDYITFVSQK